MLKMMYVVTGTVDAKALCRVMLERAVLPVKVQKYAGIGKSSLQPVWQESIEAGIKLGGLSNEMTGDNDNALLMAWGRVVDTTMSKPAPKLEKAYSSSHELSGLFVDILFDTQRKVGVITEGSDYNRSKVRRVIKIPSLDLLADEGELVREQILKAMGLPKELISCGDLLLELMKRQ